MARFQSCFETAHAPWRTGKASAIRATTRSVCSLGLTFVLAAPPARADVTLVPAEDGRLGAWLVAGPLPGALPLSGNLRAPPRLAEPLDAQNGTVRWRLLAGDAGTLDLGHELGVKESDRARALVGGELRLEQKLDGWLLISADGGVAVWIDGQPLWSRDTDRVRDRSWDVLPLSLEKGVHQLLIGLHQRGPHWAFGCRILDRKDLLPPPRATFSLPGIGSTQTAQLAAKLLEAVIEPGLDDAGFRPRVKLSFPGGFPAELGAAVTVIARAEGSGQPRWEARLGRMAPSERGAHPWAARLPRLSPEAVREARRWEFELRVGSTRRTYSWLLDPAAPALLRRATDVRQALGDGRLEGLLDPHVVDATLELWLERLQQGERAGNFTGPLDDWLMELEARRDPLARPGVWEIARRSKLDGHPTPMAIHVPAAYAKDKSRRFPLVVLLHGYEGNPRRIMRAFLGQMRSDPVVDGFIVAPHAYGNSFYRGPGEQDALDAVDWMLDRYPIDPDRVSVSGVSMGGTGAAHLALLYAERFSRAAPLCGYQSYFLRRDIAHRPTRPWELRRMHHWSPASWAPNGRHLPLWVAQGTRDLPLSNSRVLVDAYRQLGYPVTAEWPDTGHAVWEKTYAGARLWPWLTGATRARSAAHVTLATDALRYGTLDWLRVTALGDGENLGRIDAERVSPDRVVVKTADVTGFELDRDRARLGPDRVTIEVDGTALSFAAAERVAAHRDPGGWHPGPPDRGARDKRAGVEGPIDDAFLGPLIFVYGSLDPRWTSANREVANTLARMRYGVQIRYPVVADSDLDRALEATHSLVLVGNAQSHSLIRRLDATLPIRIVGDAVRVGGQNFAGPTTGTTFVYPNPEHPEHYLLLVEGVSVPGLYYALSLPALLPDFAVYDSGVASAAGQQILGEAEVLAAGFFRQDWSLPPASLAR